MAVARSVSSMRQTQFSSSPASASAARITLAMAVLERMASLPPRSMQALPLFKHSAAASEVTLGRASKMMPMTPSGTVIFSISSPQASVEPDSTRPTGSASAATSRTPSAMPLTRASERESRSSMEGDMPFARAASTSSRLARSMSSACASSAAAMAMSAAFFCAVEAFASAKAASLAAAPMRVRSVMLFPPCWRGTPCRSPRRRAGGRCPPGRSRR